MRRNGRVEPTIDMAQLETAMATPATNDIEPAAAEQASAEQEPPARQAAAPPAAEQPPEVGKAAGAAIVDYCAKAARFVREQAAEMRALHESHQAEAEALASNLEAIGAIEAQRTIEFTTRVLAAATTMRDLRLSFGK